MEMTLTFTQPAFASACAPSVVLPVNRARVAVVPAVASPLAAQLVAPRPLHRTLNPIVATAPAGVPVPTRTTGLISTIGLTSKISKTSPTKGYRQNESKGMQLDGFGGVPPRGIPV